MICLTMIARNEAHVVERALASALPLADVYYIQDNGSTDDTVDRVKAALPKDPHSGRVETVPWVDFASNRTAALRRAEEVHRLEPKDYHLILDADDVVEAAEGWPESVSLARADAFELTVVQGGVSFPRTHLLRADGLWRWRCPVHEYMHRDGDGPCVVEAIDPSQVVYRSLGGGQRSLDPEKYSRDAALLEKFLATVSPSDRDLIPRATFYLAQSYRDAGQAEAAARNYTARYEERGGYAQERYVSCLEMAALNPTNLVSWYRRAFQLDPFRVEAPFWLAKHYAEVPLQEGEALLWATYAASLPPRGDALFSHPETYGWAKNLLDYLRNQLTVSRW